MANNDFNNLKQLKSAISRAKGHTDSNIAEFANTMFGSLNEMVQYRDVTIAVSTWKTTTDATMLAKGYKYYSDVAIANLHANDLVFTIFKTSEFDILSTAKVSSGTGVYDGYVRHYAKSIPSAALSARIYVVLEDFDSI